MFDILGDLLDRDGRHKHRKRSTGLRGIIQRIVGGLGDDDHRKDRGRSYRHDDDDDYAYRGRRRRRYHEDDDDDD